MNNIDAMSLKKGMMFSAPLFFDDGKNMFITEKCPIEKFHLETIKRWKIKTLVTFGKEITLAELEAEKAAEKVEKDEVVEVLDDLEVLEELEEVEDLEEL